MNIDPQSISVISGAVVAVVTVIGFIVNAQRSLDDKFNKQADTVMELMSSHEDKDQKRHEDNIQRFAIIETKLDTVIKNGHSK